MHGQGGGLRMARPNLDMSELGTLFRQRGIYYLYHANAVETSLTYFRENALLSRQHCQTQGLPQTYQKTDSLDQKYGIFDDIFMNLDDQHLRFRKPNEYGPVLFHIKVDRMFEYLSSVSGASVNITRKNPHKWLDSDSQSERWLMSVREVDGLFTYPQEHHLKYFRRSDCWPDVVISGLNEGLPLSVLGKVWLEEPPQMPNFIDQFHSKVNALNSSFLVDLIAYREQCAAAGCACSDPNSYEKPNIKPKLDFGSY